MNTRKFKFVPENILTPPTEGVLNWTPPPLWKFHFSVILLFKKLGFSTPLPLGILGWAWISSGTTQLYSSPMDIIIMLLHANSTVVNIQGNNIFHISHHSYESKNKNSTLLEKSLEAFKRQFQFNNVYNKINTRTRAEHCIVICHFQYNKIVIWFWG